MTTKQKAFLITISIVLAFGGVAKGTDACGSSANGTATQGQP